MAKAATAQKSEAFVWEGTNKQGKRIKGESTGTNIALVKADLRRQGITPLKVKKKPTSLLGGKRKKKITAKDIAIFSRQLDRFHDDLPQQDLLSRQVHGGNDF